MKLLKSFSAIWFSIGIILTTATQTRFGGLPIGPGEIMLSIWLILACISLLQDKRISLSPPVKPFLKFWFLAALLLTLGCWSAIYRGIWNEKSCYHDSVAFLFVAVLFTIFAIKPYITERMEQISYYVLSFSVYSMLLLFLYGQLFSKLGPLNLWCGERFTGWGKNPNQSAILIGMVPFIGLHMFNKCNSFSQKLWYGLLIFASLFIGIATKSDALMVSWIISGLLLFFLLFHRGTSTLYKHYWRNILIYSLAGLAILFLFLPHGFKYSDLKSKVYALYYQGDQGPVRFSMYMNGLEAICASPICGLGPGAYSGRLGMFQGTEAHNTFIDWGCSTGILGLLMYIGLLVWLLSLTWVKKEFALFIAMVNMIVFSLFHYILRHPIFWFYLLMISTVCWNENVGQTQFIM